jgi:hypothetical protein
MGRALLFVGLFLRLLNKLMLYCLYTLVDITATGHYRGSDRLLRNQQQNFDTILQTLGLKGNVYFDNKPRKIPAKIFGNEKIDCWYFEWTMEISDLFATETDPIGQLKELFNFVPYIDDLTEQVQFTPAVFKLGHNIIFDFKQ